MGCGRFLLALYHSYIVVHQLLSVQAKKTTTLCSRLIGLHYAITSGRLYSCPVTISNHHMIHITLCTNAIVTTVAAAAATTKTTVSSNSIRNCYSFTRLI